MLDVDLLHHHPCLFILAKWPLQLFHLQHHSHHLPLSHFHLIPPLFLLHPLPLSLLVKAF
uniref:Formin-like protein n=1 Tax=Rhizophora mucronata TaxID=61149 RepID=A0A2P2MUC8_RHIMU